MADDFRTDFEVDLTKYGGLWYELARTPNSFEDNEPRRRGKRFSACYNAKAEYDLQDSHKVRIKNTCSRRSSDGTVISDSVHGVGLVQRASGGRKLKVAFGPAIGRLLQRLLTGGGGAYWIYCLGPVNKNGLYDWAVVSGARRSPVFLLTREKRVPDNLKTEMLACAHREGLPVGELIYRQE